MHRWVAPLPLLLLLSVLLMPPTLHASPVIGAIDPRVTQANIHQTICRPGYSRSVRPSTSYTNRLKRELLAEAGLTGQASAYRLDHIVSLDLGGAPRLAANFQLQPWTGPTGARAKDQAEATLHRAVCAHRLSLADAQACIAHDWRDCAWGAHRGHR